MKRNFAVLFALPLLAACGGGRPTDQDYLQVVPLIVQFMEQDARANMMGTPSEGPLWIDARGFMAMSRQVTGGDTISRARIMETIGRGREAEPRQVLLIAEEGGFGGRWVREYGIHVSPNVGRATRDQITAIVGGYVTDRRTFPTEICDRIWRLRFNRGEDGRWSLTDRQLTRNCLDDAAAAE